MNQRPKWKAKAIRYIQEGCERQLVRAVLRGWRGHFGELDDLEQALKAELVAERVPQQLDLFSDDERTQLKRDHAALEARLARIPLEREQEVRAIEERHSNAVEHTFPVAVILLVPNSLATGTH